MEAGFSFFPLDGVRFVVFLCRKGGEVGGASSGFLLLKLLVLMAKEFVCQNRRIFVVPNASIDDR